MTNKKSKSVLLSRFSNKLSRVLLRVTGIKYRLHQQDRVCPGTRLKEVCGHKGKVRPGNAYYIDQDAFQLCRNVLYAQKAKIIFKYRNASSQSKSSA